MIDYQCMERLFSFMKVEKVLEMHKNVSFTW
jgi:hypothetical protein